MSNPNQAVLAFSGGLDTSFAVPYLREQGLDIITATVDTGGFTESELSGIAAQSERVGAVKHFQIDARAKMFEDVASYIIKSNGLYEGAYPNMCADRYVIAEEVVAVARDEGATAVVHGSSAMGNDQVRFDMAFASLAPDLQVITPIRDTGGNRQKQHEFLAARGLEMKDRSNKYSVNQNILGITYSGAEIDDFHEADEGVFEWTQPTQSESEHIDLSFEGGIPVAIDGQDMAGEEILSQLNYRVGAHGFGRRYYTGDCIVGIKGRIAFEAPGLLALIEAHRAVEQLVHTKAQHDLGSLVSSHLTDLLFAGRYYDPAVRDAKAFLDANQQDVTGEVTIKVDRNQVLPVEVSAQNALTNPDVATYAQSASWDARDAEGFIRLYGLQNSIASRNASSRR